MYFGIEFPTFFHENLSETRGCLKKEEEKKTWLKITLFAQYEAKGLMKELQEVAKC